MEGLLDRDELVNVQLPQKFDRAKLLAAHEAARGEDADFTEDAGLFYHYTGEPVRILPGSDENIKITVPTDTVTAEAIYADLLGRGILSRWARPSSSRAPARGSAGRPRSGCATSPT